MNIILLAIKPRYAADIYAGRKTIEFRRVIPRCMLPENGGESVKAFLYESAPVSKVTGACVLSVRSFSPDGIFDSGTLGRGCVTEDESSGYFRGKSGYALSVSGIEKFPGPAHVREFLTMSQSRPPQNFLYVQRDVKAE
jgi:predicted transcriptional regulator